MKALRTPDARFVDLPDFPFEPRYVDVEPELRMHFVDEGPRDGQVVLLLHGEPSWSYLYRKMIPPLVAAGLRAVAPDLIGFGRSDKPASREDYTYERHVGWVWALVERLGLRDVTLFCQDWGGLIGLRVVAEHPEVFARVVASNTFLPTGDQPMPDAFVAWRDFSQTTPVFPVGAIIEKGCARPISPEVRAAYDAPFPDDAYKEGARQFPMLVPARPDDPASAANRRAWEVLRAWDKPFVTLFGDSDPITRGADRLLQAMVPGAAGQPHATLAKAGHFSQEDAGAELAEHVVRLCARG